MSAWAAVKAFGAVVIELCGGKRAFAFLLFAIVGWVVASSWRFRYEQATQAHAKHLDADKAAAGKAAEAARETEYTHRVREGALLGRLETERHAAKVQLDRALAGVRAGAVVVRNDRKCPAVQAQAAGPAASGDEAGAVYLPVAAVERVLQLGAEADDAARQLTACQALVLADREALK